MIINRALSKVQNRLRELDLRADATSGQRHHELLLLPLEVEHRGVVVRRLILIFVGRHVLLVGHCVVARPDLALFADAASALDFDRELGRIEGRPNLSDIIYNSVKFQNTRETILLKINVDFKAANGFVKSDYEKCRKIHEFCNEPKNKEFYNRKLQLDDIKKEITKMKNWKEMIAKYIPNERAFGIVNVDGKQQKNNVLNPYLSETLENLKTYLEEMFRDNLKETEKAYDAIVANLGKNTETLTDFTTFVENLNYAKEQQGPLGEKKLKVERMNEILKKSFSNERSIIRGEDRAMLSSISDKYDLITEKIYHAENIKKEKLDKMVGNISKAQETLNKSVSDCIARVNSDKLVEEDTPPETAIRELNRIKIEIDKFMNTNEKHGRYKELLG